MEADESGGTGHQYGHETSPEIRPEP